MFGRAMFGRARFVGQAVQRPLALAVAVLAMTATIQTVTAQDRTVESLSQQLERVQRDLIDIQRFVYQNNVRAPESAVAAATAQPTPAPDSAGVAAAGGNFASLEVRMNQFERELTQLTGNVEKLGFSMRQLTERVDSLVTDIDYRLQELEKNGGNGVAAAGAATTDSQLSAVDAAAGSATAVSDTTADPATSGQSDAVPGETETAALPTGSAMDQYNAAFSLLRQSAFADAEAAFRTFVIEHPTDRLVGNAQYWLGETYFIRGLYDDAAVVFLDGYNQYPDSAKAPDMLLKLSITLNKLGQQQEACATLSELARRFPEAEPRVKDRASAESETLNCSA